MVKLGSFFQFTIDDQGDPILPDPQDPQVQIWHDYHGKECAYAYKDAGDYWLYFPYVASYRISRTLNQISAYPEPLSSHSKIQDHYFRIVLPIALHIRGTQVLHASAIVAKHGVAAFCAMSETGKSTTAYALSQRGYEQWADDAVPFEITGRSVQALPFEFERRIDSRAAKHLGSSGDFLKSHDEDSGPLPLSIIFVLHRMNRGTAHEIDVRRLSAAQAFRSVLLHAQFFNLSSMDLKKDMVAAYMRLTSLLPVVEIHFQPGFQKLAILLDEIEKIIVEGRASLPPAETKSK